jgi:hypothetical protein
MCITHTSELTDEGTSESRQYNRVQAATSKDDRPGSIEAFQAPRIEPGSLEPTVDNLKSCLRDSKKAINAELLAFALARLIRERKNIEFSDGWVIRMESDPGSQMKNLAQQPKRQIG